MTKISLILYYGLFSCDLHILDYLMNITPMSTTFCYGDYPVKTTFMFHDSLWHHNDITRYIHYDVPMSNDIAICKYHDFPIHNNVVEGLFYYVLLYPILMLLFPKYNS